MKEGYAMKKFLSLLLCLTILAVSLCSLPVQADWESDLDYQDGIPGDLNLDNVVNNKDVEYLLWHTLFSEDYPVDTDVDFNGDDVVNNKDVEYLLWHTLFPEDYPIG